MFGNISNHELFGDWSRLEDDYLGCNGMEDNFAFSKAGKYPGFFRSGVTLIAATPVLNPETGRATRAWKVTCETIVLDAIPLSDIADMLSCFDCETITDFQRVNREASDESTWQQALGELFLRLRICGDDYDEWMICPSAESARNVMNHVMGAHLPEGFLDENIIYEDERADYGLGEEARDMASGSIELGSQTESKGIPAIAPDKEVK